MDFGGVRITGVRADGNMMVVTLDTTEAVRGSADADFLLGFCRRPEIRDNFFGQGLVLRVDLIGAWAHWVTPTFEPRRFDTRFFIAAVPEGQQVGELPGEADRAAWWPIREIWPAVESGTYMMLPPTAVTCPNAGDGLVG